MPNHRAKLVYTDKLMFSDRLIHAVNVNQLKTKRFTCGTEPEGS